MIKLLTIEDCSQCRYRLPIMNWKELKIKGFTCTVLKKDIKKTPDMDNHIPDWCPLESVKQEEEESEGDDGIA